MYNFYHYYIKKNGKNILVSSEIMDMQKSQVTIYEKQYPSRLIHIMHTTTTSGC